MDSDEPFSEDEFIGHLSVAVHHIDQAIRQGRPAHGNVDLIAALAELENATTVLRKAIGDSA